MARYDKFYSKGDYGMKEGKREEILRLIENKSRIALRSVGSVEILQIINTVPAIPTIGSTGPSGTLKLLGAFGRRCLSTSTSICAKI